MLVRGKAGAADGSGRRDHVISSSDDAANVLEACQRGSIGIMWIAHFLHSFSDGCGAPPLVSVGVCILVHGLW